MDQSAHKDLKLDTYGAIPALLISHVAVHRDYERRGIGRHMVSWAMKKAEGFSKDMGCRMIVLEASKKVIGFYRKLNFTHIEHQEGGSNNMFYDMKRNDGGSYGRSS